TARNSYIAPRAAETVRGYPRLRLALLQAGSPEVRRLEAGRQDHLHDRSAVAASGMQPVAGDNRPAAADPQSSYPAHLPARHTARRFLHLAAARHVLRDHQVLDLPVRR